MNGTTNHTANENTSENNFSNNWMDHPAMKGMDPVKLELIRLISDPVFVPVFVPIFKTSVFLLPAALL